MPFLIPLGIILVHAVIGAMLMRAAVAASNKLLKNEPAMPEPSFVAAFGIMVLANIILTVAIAMLRPMASPKALLLYLPVPLLLVVLIGMIAAFLKASLPRAALVAFLQVAFVTAISAFFAGIYYLVT